MNFGKAFTYIFDDKEWFDKLIIPLLVALIPVVGPLAMSGYVMRVTKNVSQHSAEPLPLFEFGSDLGKGFRWMLITLVYSLPAILISLLMILPLQGLGNNSSSVLAILAIIILGALLAILILLMLVCLPLAQVNFAIHDTFASGFDFKLFMSWLKNNITVWLITLGGLILASFIAPLGSILLLIGSLITGFYSQLLVAHLAGQAYALSQTPKGEGVQPF